MLNPEHRQAFVDVRRSVAAMKNTSPRHKNLERVLRMHGHRSPEGSKRSAKHRLEKIKRMQSERPGRSRLVDWESIEEGY